MKNNNFKVGAFLAAPTKEQADLIARFCKAEYYMDVHEAVQAGDYRYWANAMHIAECIAGDENFFIKRFYAQMDGFVRIAKQSGMLARIPVKGSHKRALYEELSATFNELAELRKKERP